jgi:hypothetical protein
MKVHVRPDRKQRKFTLTYETAYSQSSDWRDVEYLTMTPYARTARAMRGRMILLSVERRCSLGFG